VAEDLGYRLDVLVEVAAGLGGSLDLSHREEDGQTVAMLVPRSGKAIVGVGPDAESALVALHAEVVGTGLWRIGAR
jgi:hypothetical protein